MASSRTAALAQEEVRPSEQRLSGLIGAVRQNPENAQAALKEHEGEWLLQCASDAIDACMQRKVAASTMKMDAGLMTNRLKGEGHMPLRPMGLMPIEFFEEWIERIRMHFKLDSDEERLNRAAEYMTRGLVQLVEIARKGMKK